MLDIWQQHTYAELFLKDADAALVTVTRMRVTTRNTMAPCVVIGERASDFIRHGPWPLTGRSRINRKRESTAGSCEIVQRGLRSLQISYHFDATAR
jgi:hypothetical protein